jgi:hypothetical protein
MNISILLSFLVTTTSFTSLWGMETKVKCAEQAESRSSFADSKSAAEEQVAKSDTVLAARDSLCPEGFSADIWALVADYAVDMSGLHEAFTYSKTFLDVQSCEAMEDGRIDIVGSLQAGFERYRYSFRDKAVSQNNSKQILRGFYKKCDNFMLVSNQFHKHQLATEVTAYRPDGVTLINKFSVQDPQSIDYYTEVTDKQIAFTINKLSSLHRDNFHQLVIWNPESNKIEYAQDLFCLIDYIIPLSRGRLALTVRDQSRVIVKDLTTQKYGELVLEKCFRSWDKLFELATGNILTWCGGVLNVWDGVVYAKLLEISKCHAIERLSGKIVIKHYDNSMSVLDEITLRTEQLAGASETAPSTIKIDDATLLIDRSYRQEPYQIYSADGTNDFLLIGYLNRLIGQKGSIVFKDRQVFRIIEPYQSTALPKHAKQIIWYDQEAIMQLRKIDLVVRYQLSGLLERLRDCKAKLAAADSTEPIALDVADSFFLASLPERIQENIKSHFKF